MSPRMVQEMTARICELADLLDGDPGDYAVFRAAIAAAPKIGEAP